jgi:hypothetical protein
MIFSKRNGWNSVSHQPLDIFPSFFLQLRQTILASFEVRLELYQTAAVFRLKFLISTVEFNRFSRTSTDALSTLSFSCTGAQYSLGC